MSDNANHSDSSGARERAEQPTLLMPRRDKGGQL